ncbi:MAG: Com family DNA-binding transcriptional regulator [Candidatus Margulisbacteria bacterium]|nr:Com family DNA-binding transcriptional regulator [Candidatus Margulisiibacteriota bacterium]
MLKEFRCSFCNRLLAKVGENSKVEIKCPKCKALNLYQNDAVVIYDLPENNVTKKIIARNQLKFGALVE